MSIKDRICQHLQASGISHRESSRLASLTQKWLVSSGPVWAAERWKILGNYAHMRLVDPLTPIPKYWAVRQNRKGKTILKDRFLHRVLEIGGTPTMGQLKIIEAIVRIPSAILDEHPTLEKKRKTLASITMPFTGRWDDLSDELVNEFTKRFDRIIPDEGVRFGHNFVPLRSMPESNKRSPYWEEKEGSFSMQAAPRTNIMAISPTWFSSCKVGRELLRKYSLEVSQCLTGHEGWLPEWTCEDDDDLPETLPVGRIAFLSKDGSAKTRCIANPCMDVQKCLEPLQRVLMWALKHCPASAVHNQQDGIQWVKEQLAQGKVCCGFDQSSFTDRFPYAFQRHVLLSLKDRGWPVHQFDIDLMDHCVSTWWTVPSAGMSLTYAVGQPMGLNPSFPLATLGHLCVVNACCDKQRLQDVCRIVGDDIVISDLDVARRYNDLMVGAFGVTINVNKTLRSSFATQFCGKLITPNGVVPSTKIRVIREASSLVQKLLHYGPESEPYFAKLLRLYPEATLPQPLGFGYKPRNLSFPEWIKSINAADYQRSSIEHDIRDFLGVTVKVDESLVQRHMDWDQVNPNLMGGSEASRLRQMSEAEGNPSVIGEVAYYSDERPKEAFSDLFDRILSQSSHVWEVAGGVLSKDGYISANERPSRIFRGDDGASSSNDDLDITPKEGDNVTSSQWTRGPR